MMTNDFLKQIISEVSYIIITTIISLIMYYIKQFLNTHKSFIEKQEEVLKQQLGDAQYKKDKDKAIDLIFAVEEMGKNNNWEGVIKHSKATELISKKTGLDSDSIYDIIKSVVGKMNQTKVISTESISQKNNIDTTSQIEGTTNQTIDDTTITKSTATTPSDINSSEVKPIEHTVIESVVNTPVQSVNTAPTSNVETPVQENNNVVSKDIINAINELQKLVNK